MNRPHDTADEFNAFNAADADRPAGDIAAGKLAYQKTLDKLIDEIDALPAPERDKLRSVADEASERHKRLVQTVGKLQETLDFLRVGVKYLVFDIEATKRENNYLRKLLDEASGDD